MTDSTRGGLRFGPARPWSRDFFRIVSWNIERGLQFPKILDFLQTIQADLLLLQEVDLNARRTRYRDIASELARCLNLNYVFGMEFQELSEGTAARPAYHGWRRSHHGRSREPGLFVSVTSPRSGSRVGMCRISPTFQRRIGGRIALVAEANIYGRKVVTYNLHLESRGADELRLRQLNEVLADCRRYVDRPSFVVAGDFNLDAGAGDAARALGDAGFRDAVGSPGRPTTPAHVLSHARAIDWIFVSDTAGFPGPGAP